MRDVSAMVIESTVTEQIEADGFAVICGEGNSMRPLLRPLQDHVLIEKPEGAPKKYDVVLYRRPDGTNVLHRVVGFDGDICIIRGDNTFYKERVPVDAVAGIAKVFWRGKREIRATDFIYRVLAGLWNDLYPLRLLKHKAAGGIHRAARRIPADTAPGWILRRAGASLGAVAVLTCCTCLNAILSVYTALVMREAVDSAVGLDRDGFLRWAAIFFAIVLAELASNALIRQLEEHVKATVENTLKRRAYDGILHSAYGSLKEFHTGELLNRLTNDTKVVAEQVALLIPGFIAMVVRLVGALAVLIAIDWRFGSLFLAGGLVLAVTTLLFRKRLKTMHKSMQEADGQLRAWLTESVESVQILKSFEAEGMAESRAERLTETHKRERMRRATFSNLCNIGFGAIMQGSYLFGFLWCGAGILRGTLTYGTLTAVLSLVSQIRAPLANISGYVPRYYAMTASAERLMELEQLPGETQAEEKLEEKSPEKDEPLGNRSPQTVKKTFGQDNLCGENLRRNDEKGHEYVEKRHEYNEKKYEYGEKRREYVENRHENGSRGGKKLPEFCELHAEHLSFSYEDGEEVIRDASFTVRRGEIVALTGQSGIGKSTLLKLLLGIYQPKSGKLYGVGRESEELRRAERAPEELCRAERAPKELRSAERTPEELCRTEGEPKEVLLSGCDSGKSSCSGYDLQESFYKKDDLEEFHESERKPAEQPEKEAVCRKCGKEDIEKKASCRKCGKEDIEKKAFRRKCGKEDTEKKATRRKHGKEDIKKMEIGPATRAWFSYVPQGNMLLSGSIYEAVDFLHTAPYSRRQKERVEEACRIACADEFIRALPEGYETVLGEKGSGLSEGQMQRIAIARAIYRDAPVLLLDEATSALDAETEKRLLQNLKARPNQTVLVVTHRPAALNICTKILRFEKTGICEEEI